jgi:hypothetical protein
MPASRRRCELKVGSAVLPATIFDYSEDGFAVLFSGHPPAPKGRVQLHSKQGWFDCRVAYVKRIVRVAEPDAASPVESPWDDPSDAPSSAPTDTAGEMLIANGEWFRIGLRKLGQIPPPR